MPTFRAFEIVQLADGGFPQKTQLQRQFFIVLVMDPSPTDPKNGVHEQEQKDTAHPHYEQGSPSKVLDKETGKDTNIDDQDLFSARNQKREPATEAS
jgi:hypothetical protein